MAGLYAPLPTLRRRPRGRLRTDRGRRGCYSFIAVDFHRILLASLPAHIAVGTAITGRPPQSGRIEARTGLRMMPTFPRSPLSFRTAGFPQYGWKAGFPSGAFPDHQRLKPAPGIRSLSSSLHPPFVHLVATTLSRTVSGRALDCAPPWRVITPPPQGSSLGFGL